MGLADFALGQAKSLVKQKLSGHTAQFVDLAERLYKRSNSALGKPNGLQPKPGPRHWWQAANGRPDPLLNVFWYADFPALNGGTIPLPWYYVEEMVLPHVEFEQVSNYRAGKNYHYPNHYNLNTIQATLYEDVYGTSLSYLSAWEGLMLDRETGLYNVPMVYKQPIIVTVLDAAQSTVMVYEYTNCWPMSVDNSTYTSGNSDKISTAVTFSVDEVRIKFGKFEAEHVPSMVNNIGQDFPHSLSNLPQAFPDMFKTVTAKLFR